MNSYLLPSTVITSVSFISNRTKSGIKIILDEINLEEVEGQEHATDNFKINPNSKVVLENCYVESDVEYTEDDRYQFIRNGYFCLDKDTTEQKMVFNRTITLKDTKKFK